MPIIASRASAAYGAGFAAITAIPYQGPFGAYDALATVTVGATPVGNITFAGIPAGYKHLQLRYIARSNNSGSDGNASTGIRFNSDGGNNYASHQLSGGGGGGAPVAGAFTGQAYIFGFMVAGGLSGANTFGLGIIDILDYDSTSKNKTLRTLNAYDNNGSGTTRMASGLWMNTSPITSIFIDGRDGFSFTQHSQFALYGVR
jgi:hypothetical protein